MGTISMRKPRKQLHVEELEGRILLSSIPLASSFASSAPFSTTSGHTSAPTAAPIGMPTPREIANAMKLVEANLAKHNASYAGVHVVTNDAFSKEFPNQIFLSVLFQQYPVGRVVPAPYKTADIYAVTRGKAPQLQLITNASSLQGFFRHHLRAVITTSGAKEAITAWLALSPLLLQDGFYGFQLVTDSIKAEMGKSGLQASG